MSYGRAVAYLRLALLVSLPCTGCAGALPATLGTGAGALSVAWKRSSVDGAQVALHRAAGGTITASLSCDAVDEDAPLDVLLNHVLLELDSVEEHGRETFVVDGRAALRARLTVRLDGVPVALVLVVLKKDGCVADAQLAVAEHELARCEPDFARFVAGLSISRRVK